MAPRIVSPPPQVLTADHPRRAEYLDALRTVQHAAGEQLAASERLASLERELGVPPREARALAVELLGPGVEIPAPIPDPRTGGFA